MKTLKEVLTAWSEIGFRLKSLRIRRFDGCETRMVPLAQLVNKLEFHCVGGKVSRGLELPEECMTRRGRWEHWSRVFVGSALEGLCD